jgi:hypothetical protein
MPYFLVEVQGDPARAAGRLALQGIQNVVHDAPQTLTARLSANDREAAVRRVRAALEGEAFTVEDDAARAELA